MGLYSVYRHTSPNGKVYIGITSKKPEYRWNGGRGYWQNKHFTNAIMRYGWDNFKHEILATGLEKSAACDLERAMIAYHKSNDPNHGYNNSIGGENPNEGHKATKEEIAKRSAAIRGRKMSEKGKAHIRAAKQGKPNGLKGRTGERSQNVGVVRQIDRETGKVVAVFYGFDEVNRKTGFARTPVREAAHGKRRQAYGFLWEYEKKVKENVAV